MAEEVKGKEEKEEEVWLGAEVAAKECYAVADWMGAVAQWRRCIALVTRELQEEEGGGEQVAKWWGNIAQAQIKAELFAEAVQSATRAVDSSGVAGAVPWLKAVWRRAVALRQLGRYSDALADVETLLAEVCRMSEEQQRSVQAMVQSVVALKAQLMAEERADRKAMEKEASDGTSAVLQQSLVHEAQALRLFVRVEEANEGDTEHVQAPESEKDDVVAGEGGEEENEVHAEEAALGTFVPGKWTTCSFNIANEFGLWKRSDLTLDGPPLHLRVELLPSTAAAKWQVECAPLSSSSTSTSSSSSSISLSTEPCDTQVQFSQKGRAQACVRIVPAVDAPPPTERVGVLRFFTDPPALPSSGNGSGSERHVIPVLSSPIRLVWPTSAAGARQHDAAADDANDAAADDDVFAASAAIGVQCCRLIEANGLSQPIYALESPGQLGIGGKLWDSALSLLEFLAAPDTCGLLSVSGGRVLELGAGTGVVGIGCALLMKDRAPAAAAATIEQGGRDERLVVITDMEEVVPLIHANIVMNMHMSTADSVSTTGVMPPCMAQPLLWGSAGTAPSEEALSANVVVMSDVVYDPVGYLPLIETIARLSMPGTAARIFVIAHRHRHPSDMQFFELLSGLGDRTGRALHCYEVVDAGDGAHQSLPCVQEADVAHLESLGVARRFAETQLQVASLDTSWRHAADGKHNERADVRILLFWCA